MADGKIQIEVDVDGKGVTILNNNLDQLEGKSNKAGASIKNLVISLGLVKVAAAAFNVLKNSLDAAISRFDTMQKFPKVMKALGFSAEESQRSINKLSDGIDGLPTKLDDVVASTQQMTAITGDLDKSTDTVLALNNAFLASGASTDDASRGMQQYNQMLSTGQVDLESWKTLQETMPLALQKTAEAMGFVGKSAQRDLYTALKEGTVTFDQFQDKLIELGTGTGMLADLAKENSLGIATSFGNLRNAVSKGVANMITKFDELTQKLTGQSIAQNIDGMKALINKAFTEMAKGMQYLIDHSDDLIQAFEETKRIVELLAPAFVGAAAGYLAFQTTVAVGSAFTAIAKGVSLVIGQLETLQILLLILQQEGIAAFAKATLGVIAGPIKALIAAAGGLVTVIVVSVAAIAAALVYLYKTNETFRNGVNKTIEVVRNGLAKAFEYLRGVLASVLPVLQNVTDMVGNHLAKGLQKFIEFGSLIASFVVPAFEAFAHAVKNVISSGIEKFGAMLSQIGSVLSGVFCSGMELAGNLLEKLGGSFGKIGGVISIVVSMLTKVAIAALGLTGPLGLVISLVISFMAAWAKTGDFSADGITIVFDQLSETIRNVADSISKYLPKIIETITSIITGIVDKIIEMLPQLTEAAIQIIQSLTQAIVSYLPKLTETATSIISTLVQGISIALPKLLTVATEIITTLINALSEILPQMIEIGVKLLTTLINGIISTLPKIIEVVVQIINTIVDAFITVLPMLLEIGLQIVTTLVNAIVTALPQLVTAATTIVTGLLSTIIEALPTLIDAGIQMLMALINGLLSVLPLLINASIQIVLALIGALINALPQIINAGIQLILALIQGIISIIPQIIAAGIQLIIALVNAVISMLPQLISSGIKLIVALVNGVISVLPQLVSAALQLISALLRALIGAIPQLLSAGIQLISALVRGILSLVGQLVAAGVRLITSLLSSIASFLGRMLRAGADLISNLVSGITSSVGSVINAATDIGSSIMDTLGNINLFDIGKNIIQGLVNGIGSMVGAVTSKIAEVAGNIKDKITGALGIHSPSRWMRDYVGKFIPQGVAVGIEADAKTAYSAMDKLSNGLMKTITPESALGTSRMGMASVGSQIVNNTYNNQKQIDIDKLAQIISRKPVKVLSYLDGSLVGENIDNRFGKTINRRRYTNGG